MHTSSSEDYDGQSQTLWAYVSRSAVHTLSQVAPHGHEAQVARTVVRLEGKLQEEQHNRSLGTHRVFIAWTPAELTPFGPPLVDELRRLLTRTEGDDRLRAERVLRAALGQEPSWSDRNVDAFQAGDTQ
jgi:hypothetical protein